MAQCGFRPEQEDQARFRSAKQPSGVTDWKTLFSFITDVQIWAAPCFKLWQLYLPNIHEPVG